MRWNRLAAAVLISLIGVGCTPKAPPRPPVVVVPPEVPPVQGVWENTVRGVSHGRAIFKANGDLTFEGGMEFYNPGRWDWTRCATAW